MSEKFVIEIDGAVTADIPHEEWLESFIEWLNSHGWDFGGLTIYAPERQEQDDD